MRFLELEGGYIFIAIFIMAVTIFVTTRSFMSKKSFKVAVPTVFIIVTTMIAAHYWLTTSRMAKVQKAFYEGKNIICESKTLRKASRTITIKQKGGWSLDGDIFVSPEYERDFHTSRCIVEELISIN